MLSIQTNFSVRNVDTNDPPLTLAPTKLVWKNHYKIVLENTFENCQSDLNQFCKQVYDKDQAGVDLATEHLSNILTSATEIVIPIKLINFKRRKNKSNKKWFDKDRFQLRSEMNRLTSRLGKNPFNPYIRKASSNVENSAENYLN